MRGRIVRLLAATAVLEVALVPAQAAAEDRHECATVLAALPVGTSSCPGVRPGGMFFRPDGAGCSWSFMFRGSDGRTYGASAGHCIWAESNVNAEQNLEEKWGPGAGPAVADSDGNKVGHFAYGAWTGDRDFSLVRLDAGVKPTAAMCYFGGPTAMYSAHDGSPVAIKHFGNGLVFGDIVPARTAIAEDTRDKYFVYALAASTPGDSGSGVITSDGKALGTLVGLSLIGETIITRLDESIERAEQVTGLKFTLVTAPVEPDVVGL